MHQLRHHFASLLLRGGVDIKRVQEWLGPHSAAFTPRPAYLGWNLIPPSKRTTSAFM